MRILVPFTVRDPVIEEALEPFDPAWRFVGDDEHAYWQVLRHEWEQCLASGDDLLIVEHDVVIRPDVIEQFEACPELWCLFGYDTMCHEQCQEAWANMLGCTRFRNELIRARPQAVVTIPPALRGWHNLCDHLAGNKVHGVPSELRPGSLRDVGFDHHWHDPLVVHNPEKGPDGDGYGRRESWRKETV